jgi:hypothetical protein
MNKKQETELDSLLDQYERRDDRRQKQLDDRHRGEQDFYLGFKTAVREVIKPEMERIATRLKARGHRCSVEEEPACATNEGYDRPGAVRFVFIPDQRHSQGREDPAATFSAGGNMRIAVSYSAAVPVMTDPAALPRDLELADITPDLVSGQILAMVKALL